MANFFLRMGGQVGVEPLTGEMPPTPLVLPLIGKEQPSESLAFQHVVRAGFREASQISQALFLLLCTKRYDFPPNSSVPWFIQCSHMYILSNNRGVEIEHKTFMANL